MYYNLTAIILKRQDFKDDDLLITVYSKEKGKVVLQAKGAKKIRSKLAGHLEPLSLSILNITRGKNIEQLIGAQLVKPYKKIKADVNLLAYANYFIELIDGLTQQNQADERVFNLLNKSFERLENEFKQLALARISFGFKLLLLLGFDPSAKRQQEFKKEISFIIKNSINVIQRNQSVVKNLAELNKSLNAELEIHLEREIKSKYFLEELNSSH